MSKRFQWLRRWLPATGLMIAIFIFSSLTGDQVHTLIEMVKDFLRQFIQGGEGPGIDWTIVGHACGYGLLGAAYLRGFAPSQHRAPWYAIGSVLLYGSSDEFHQSFVPGRTATLFDLGVDLTAACLVILLITLLQRKNKKITADQP